MRRSLKYASALCGVIGIVALATALDRALAPPPLMEIADTPSPVLPAPGRVIAANAPDQFVAPVVKVAEAPSQVDESGNACDPKWKRMIRRVTSAIGITTAYSQVVCCPCYAGMTVDAGNIAKNATTFGGVTSIVSTLSTALKLYSSISGAVGSQGSNQFGTIAQPLAVPPPNLSGVTAISMPGGVASAPDLSTTSSAAAWINSTLFSSAADAGSVQAIARRRAAAAVEAERVGYAMAIEQRADQSLVAESQAFLALGNAPTSAIGQTAALGNAAASLASDAQHWTAMEEAALEIESINAIRQLSTGGTQ